MQPSDIITAQAELLDRLTENGQFRAFVAIGAHTTTAVGSVNTWVDSNPRALDLDDAIEDLLNEGFPKDGAFSMNLMDAFPRGGAWVKGLENYVKAAYAFRVTREMGTLLEHAAMSLDEEDLCDPSLAPTGCGIVRFDQPIHVKDIRGYNMLVHWAVWGPSSYGARPKGEESIVTALTAQPEDRPALAMTFFNDAWTEPDENYLDFVVQASSVPEMGDAMQDVGRWMTVHFTNYVKDMSLGPNLVKPSAEQQAMFVANQDKSLDPGGNQSDEPQEGTNLFRYMHALFLLLNQTIVVTEETLPNRASRKRAARVGIPGKVTVIALRRHENANRQEGESMVEWSHRWVVRGHWRWQACGVGRKERRRIWIAPFIKGPEDKDLIVTDKVYDFRR